MNLAWRTRLAECAAITLLSLGLFGGCRRDPDPVVESRPPVANRKTVETLAQQEARMDATVWRDEVLAQAYERTFVKLGDEVRGATNKVAALARFDFDEIVVAKPAGGPAMLPLGIRRQRFTSAERV
jgi:hypothetical protein